jgi:hypothetical protein
LDTNTNKQQTWNEVKSQEESSLPANTSQDDLWDDWMKIPDWLKSDDQTWKKS